jgi:hypothetical protein
MKASLKTTPGGSRISLKGDSVSSAHLDENQKCPDASIRAFEQVMRAERTRHSMIDHQAPLG